MTVLRAEEKWMFDPFATPSCAGMTVLGLLVAVRVAWSTSTKGQTTNPKAASAIEGLAAFFMTRRRIVRYS
jgi:hypothetical protein